MAELDRKAQFVTEPTVALIGEMAIDHAGIGKMIDWVATRAPACLPDHIMDPEFYSDDTRDFERFASLFPHPLTRNGEFPDEDEKNWLTDNELLVELAGRKCYNSFGLKAGRKSNAEYIAHTQGGEVPHASLLYHAKLSFFIAGVSRRVSHELIRNYVGADRDEEGSPSQESTRYVENAGFFVTPPRYLAEGQEQAREHFEDSMHRSYNDYLVAVRSACFDYEVKNGEKPKGMNYKRILEAASGLLPHSVETSWIWTTNPMALAKMFRERDNETADFEYQRFARVWKRVCVEHAPNLFPQSWMGVPQTWLEKAP